MKHIFLINIAFVILSCEAQEIDDSQVSSPLGGSTIAKEQKFDLGYVHGTNSSQEGHNPALSAEDIQHSQSDSAYHTGVVSSRHTRSVSESFHAPIRSSQHSPGDSRQHSSSASEAGHAPVHSTDGLTHTTEISESHSAAASEAHSEATSQAGHAPKDSELYECEYGSSSDCETYR